MYTLLMESHQNFQNDKPRDYDVRAVQEQVHFKNNVRAANAARETNMKKSKILDCWKNLPYENSTQKASAEPKCSAMVP